MKPLLDKFDLVLLLRGVAPLDRGTQTTQSLTALVKLRNALTHFKPEWSDEQIEHAKISMNLEGRFSRSPFLPATDSLFPTAWAGHGCTTWAVGTAIQFAEEFDRKAGLHNRFELFRDKLDER